MMVKLFLRWLLVGCFVVTSTFSQDTTDNNEEEEVFQCPLPGRIPAMTGSSAATPTIFPIPFVAEALNYSSWSEVDEEHKGNCALGPVDAQYSTNSNCESECYIGWAKSGEWVTYEFGPLHLTNDRAFVDVKLRLASAKPRRCVFIYLDSDVSRGRAVEAPSAGWEMFEDRTGKDMIIFPQDDPTHNLHVLFMDGDVNLCSVSIESITVEGRRGYWEEESVPFTAEALDFSWYHDHDSEHKGNCGKGPVDAQKSTNSNCDSECYIGWVAAGEWAEYNFKVDDDQYVDITARVASALPGKYVRFSLAGSSHDSIVPSEGWDVFRDRVWEHVFVEAPHKALYIYFLDDGVNLCSIRVEPSVRHFPVLFGAEALDYTAVSPYELERRGNCYTDLVDAQRSTQSNCGSECYVAWVTPGMWLEYSFTTPYDALVDIEANVASGVEEDKGFLFQLDGQDVSMPNWSWIKAPHKGWDVFENRSVVDIFVRGGVTHKLRVLFVNGGINFCSIKVYLATTYVPRPNVLIIMTDQQKYDMIGAIQERLPWYKGKTKVQTPNLDKLYFEGTSFARAYCQCPVCAPSRTSFRTGCTIERTGVQSNDLSKKDVYSIDPLFEEKVNNLVSFEQILVEEQGYVAEYYGKWHIPLALLYGKKANATERVVQYNDYDFIADEPRFDPTNVDGVKYKSFLKAVIGDSISRTPSNGEQVNSHSTFPYEPNRLDTRYGYPPGTKLISKERGGQFERWQVGELNQMGRDSLGTNYTPSYYVATQAIKAIERLATNSSSTENAQPWIVTCSFHNPHAPMVATAEYYDRYWDLRDDFFIPPSIDTEHMINSPYKPDIDARYQNASLVKEWMVPYYALVEEIDHHVGKLMDALERTGQAKDTLVIFVSDHGEMLGAHGKREKNVFYDEAVRVPLVFRLPGRIPANHVVDEPVAHLDVFSTILDYTGSAAMDQSDGQSLRRFIEGRSIVNRDYDEEVVVSEWDYRTPQPGSGRLERKFGSETNFMVLKGDWKLILSKSASSNVIDQLYDLQSDPFEMNNLVGANGYSASDQVIGKVEHLKVLLTEWMQRMDGPNRLYSDPKYNGGEGSGDINEVKNRREWRALPIWVSDTSLTIGKPAQEEDGRSYVQNEYLYIGRTENGTLPIHGITLEGVDASHLSLAGFEGGSIDSGEHERVILAFHGGRDHNNVKDARIRIRHGEGEDKIIELRGAAAEA